MKLLLSILIWALVINLQAQWSNDPTVNNPVCIATGGQNNQRIIYDGMGGTIITWVDNRSSGGDIYAQRIDSSGIVKWTNNGVLICSAANLQYTPQLVSDDSGGAIITWRDDRVYGDIYAQRVGVNGQVKWMVDGVPICTSTGNQFSPQIIRDGNGGAIITWSDPRASAVNSDIYAQRISSNGNIQWTSNGNLICSSPNNQSKPILTTDGNGGAIITWTDERASSFEYDIYVQKINSSGSAQWTPNGVAICTLTGIQMPDDIISDDTGGAIIIWNDTRSGAYDIYSQRINSNGIVQWIPDGAAVCTAAGNQNTSRIAKGASGSVIIVWEDLRNGFDIYIQKVSPNGSMLWNPDGIAITELSQSTQFHPEITEDGLGGAIITWEDGRNGGSNYDIFAQAIDSSGVVRWDLNGKPVCSALDNQVYPVLKSDLCNGAFITWQDRRDGIDSDIYASRIDGNGNLGNLTLTFQLTINLNNGWNMVSIPGLHPTDQNVNTWWAFRDLGANVFKYAGGYLSVTDVIPGTGYWMKHTGDRTYNTGDEWPAGGIQIVTHAPLAGATGWNLIGGYEIQATAANVTTNPPGLQSGPIYKYSGGYQTATTLDPGYGYWIKLNAAGQIIIPEAMAKGEVVEYFPEEWGRIILTDATGINYTLYAVKGEVDLSQYELPPAPMAGMFDIRYSSGRIAEDLNSAIKTIEMSGITYPLTVRVERMDIRLMDETGKTVNVNLKDGEDVVISDATIQKLMVSGEMIPAEYSLEQNYPNPFNPSTVIEFSLPENVGNVKLSIYNALGEKVAELVNTALVAGKYSYQWNAQNIATGTYIYELRTDKFASVKKMMLMK